MLPGFIPAANGTTRSRRQWTAIAHARSPLSTPVFVARTWPHPETPDARVSRPARSTDLAGIRTTDQLSTLPTCSGPSVQAPPFPSFNFKWPDGGEGDRLASGHPVLAAHQLFPADHQGLPLCDVDDEMGPMGSSRRATKANSYTCATQRAPGPDRSPPRKSPRSTIPPSPGARAPRAPSRSTTRMVHGSEANNSPRMRPAAPHPMPRATPASILLLDGMPIRTSWRGARNPPNRATIRAPPDAADAAPAPAIPRSRLAGKGRGL